MKYDLEVTPQGHPRGQRMGSLKIPVQTMALNCLVFDKNRVSVYAFRRQTDEQTNKQKDITIAYSRACMSSGGDLVINYCTHFNIAN